MLKNTEGLVLRNIKYGETSIISTIYTKDFGIQAYMIRGARSNKKTGIKANYFQIGQFLDLTVQHNPSKNIQYIKVVKLNTEQAIQSQNIIRQSIAQFCCELVLRCIKEEEENQELYVFLSNFFSEIKSAVNSKLSNLPIQFVLQFASHIGFAISNNYAPPLQYFDALNGEFSADAHHNIYTANTTTSQFIAPILANNPMAQIDLKTRENTLNALLLFLKLHLDQMGEIKSVYILHQILHS